MKSIEFTLPLIFEHSEHTALDSFSLHLMDDRPEEIQFHRKNAFVLMSGIKV